MFRKAVLFHRNHPMKAAKIMTLILFGIGGGVLSAVGQPAQAASAPVLPPAPGEYQENIPISDYLLPEREQPHSGVFNPRDFGALGDGKALDSPAINKAIESAHAQGGGTVWLEGGTFVSGTILLRSNVTLHIAGNAVLRASHDIAHYGPKNLVFAENEKNITIEGPGTIAGDGESWWGAPRKPAPSGPPVVFNLKEMEAMHFDAKRAKLPERPSPFIHLKRCKGVTVRNLLLQDSTSWTLTFNRCEQARAERVVIDNNYHGPNTDGIGVVGCHNVEIIRCYVSTGDDGIVLKNGFAGDESGPMTRVRVRDCAVRSSTNCFKIGTETWGDISDIEVSNCSFFVDDVWPWTLSGIAVESVDGARVSDVWVRNIEMRNVMTPIFVRLGNRNRFGTKDKTGALEHVRIENVRALNAESPCIISGIPGLRVKDVRMKDIHIQYRDAQERLSISESVPEVETGYPEFFMFGDLPAYGLYARHVDGLQLRDFKVTPRKVNRRAFLQCDDVQDFERH